MSDVVNKIKKELDDFNSKKAKLVEELRTDFPNLFKPLFEQSTKIESIGWTQYTPYFNDGDECEFGVNNSDLYVNGVSRYDLDEVENAFAETLWKDGRRKPNPNFDPSEYNILMNFESIFQSIPDDFYKDLFGDHVQVTIHKDGRIDVEEYDHD